MQLQVCHLYLSCIPQICFLPELIKWIAFNGCVAMQYLFYFSHSTIFLSPYLLQEIETLC